MIVERPRHPAIRFALSSAILLVAVVLGVSAPRGARAQSAAPRHRGEVAGEVARTPEAIVHAALAFHFPEVLHGVGADAPIIVVADTADRVVRVRRVAITDRSPGAHRMTIELPDGILQGDVASVEVVSEVRGARGPLRIGAVLVRLTPAASLLFADRDAR